MEIKIDSEAVQGFVEQAILAQIGEEQRKAVVAQAVQALLTPRTSNLGYRKEATPLQEAFDQAVRQVASTEARRQIEDDPEVQAHLKALVSGAIAEICKDNYDGLPERVGEAIGSSVADWLRERGR